jgi:hypothetical protein
VTTPDALLADAPLQAAVAALADRNQHHLAQMNDAERRDALGHWRDLAVTVLTAAGAALGQDAQSGEPGGRAVLVFEDAGEDQIAVHASLFPQPTTEGDEMLVTPAQAAALDLLQGMAEDEDEED